MVEHSPHVVCKNSGFNLNTGQKTRNNNKIMKLEIGNDRAEGKKPDSQMSPFPSYEEFKK